MNKKQFAQLFQNAASFYRMKLSDELLDLYWRHLNHFSLHELQSALNEHYLNPFDGVRMPTAAILKQIIDWLREQNRENKVISNAY